MTKRFGITHVDEKTNERVPKACGRVAGREFGTLPKGSKVEFPPSAGGASKEEAETPATAKKEEKKE